MSRPKSPRWILDRNPNAELGSKSSERPGCEVGGKSPAPGLGGLLRDLVRGSPWWGDRLTEKRLSPARRLLPGGLSLPAPQHHLPWLASPVSLASLGSPIL